MKKYASATLILYALVSFTVLIFFASHKSASPSQVLYDPLYSEQWHLQDNAKNVAIPSAPADDMDFTMADITFHSSVCLGVKDFWESYSNNNGKELTIAILDSSAAAPAVSLRSEAAMRRMRFLIFPIIAQPLSTLQRQGRIAQFLLSPIR